MAKRFAAQSSIFFGFWQPATFFFVSQQGEWSDLSLKRDEVCRNPGFLLPEKKTRNNQKLKNRLDVFFCLFSFLSSHHPTPSFHPLNFLFFLFPFTTSSNGRHPLHKESFQGPRAAGQCSLHPSSKRAPGHLGQTPNRYRKPLFFFFFSPSLAVCSLPPQWSCDCSRLLWHVARASNLILLLSHPKKEREHNTRNKKTRNRNH